MHASEHRVFHYHANASPLGGVLRHPSESVIHTQGSASLSQAGGHAAASVGPFSLDSTVRCEQAYSRISGAERKDNRAWTTLVTCVVEGFNFLETVTADRIVAVLSVEHPREQGHPTVSVVGSHYVGLRIAGESLDPVIDHDLLRTAERTYPEQPWIENAAFLKSVTTRGAHLEKDVPAWVNKRYGWVNSETDRSQRGFVLCSIVKQVEGKSSHPVYGHIVHVPGFGNIFLGELTVDRGAFHLTMLRIELGCSCDGEVGVASAHINGRPIP